MASHTLHQDLHPSPRTSPDSFSLALACIYGLGLTGPQPNRLRADARRRRGGGVRSEP